MDENPLDGSLDTEGFSHKPPLRATLPESSAGDRLDKALAAALDPDVAAAEGLSRTRLRGLIEDGRVAVDGARRTDPSRKVIGGEVCEVETLPPRPLHLKPEAVPLDIAFEDDALLVVNKPPGMAVHPAPGAETGTLVHALLAHCGDSLSGIGGVERPGVVHRIDKDTSGLLVVAKTDRAHAGLSAQFAAHSAERMYRALAWGAPDRGDPRLMGLPAVSVAEGRFRIEAPIARARHDRKKMAVIRGGKKAVTWVSVRRRYGRDARAIAAEIECRLETGRTHQIRVHMAHIGHPLLGDPVYGRARSIGDSALGAAIASFGRQALHAELLGFKHPLNGAPLRFERSPPEDFNELLRALTAFSPPS